jgi:beta-xylosidase
MRRISLAVAATAAVAAAPVPDASRFLTQPLVKEIYTADPSAHVFGGRLYIYPSHDIENSVPQDDLGSHFDMRDYRVLSMDTVGGPVTVHDVALDIKNVPWARRQMWAPDAAEKGGRYFLYFPAKDRQDVFRIGVAVSDKPAGPFTAQPQPIAGSYSIDPAVFKDSDGKYYMYYGGIWGGQLQRWKSGAYKADDEAQPPNDKPALMPKVARLSDDMFGFAEPVKDAVIQDEKGQPLLSGDHARRFFEAPWVHKIGDTYYLSYSTGDTHFIVYATAKSPYGPFTYRGKILEPVLGWTNHHSIVEFKGKWWLFYHDSQLSGGKTHLRNVKVTELQHRPDGSIVTIDAYQE